MLRRLPVLLCLLFSLALSGCHVAKVLVPPNFRPPQDATASLDQAKQRLAAAVPCCSSFADFSYQRELPRKPERFELGSASPVASLNGVRSYFLAFHLPADVKPPYRLGLKSDLSGRWVRNSYLFAPTVVVLDAAFQPLDTQDVNLCEYMGWSSSSSGAFGSADVKSEKARYLVVYTSAKQMGSSTYWEQSPAAFSAEAPAQMTAAGNFKIDHGPDGPVWIGIIDRSFSKAVDNAVCGQPPAGDGLLKSLRSVLPTHWIGSGGSSGSDDHDSSGGGTGASTTGASTTTNGKGN